ncbi:MAG: glycosyltransferase [Polymorphobacter sp.]|uniref:glycosyltransferase n=1 Tax=Polymorphobacter sp. TaxID=1909290 RepID=UPI003A8A774E
MTSAKPPGPEVPSHRSDLPHRSEADQQAFFDTVLALAKEAEAKAGTETHDLLIAGNRIRLCFAGPALAPLLLPALSHLVVPDSDAAPDLTLHVWDSASTGVDICPPPVAQHCFSDRGDIWTFHSQRVLSAFHWSEFSLNLLDLPARTGIFWVRTSERLPYWTQASPLRTLLHWWMSSQGHQLVHAAAVGTADGGLLITGRGGVGKSTTALACLAAGLAYAGDDYVLLTIEDGRLIAHSLYRTAKINPDDTARFARFKPRILGEEATAGDAKAVMFLDEGLTPRLPIVAALTPRFGTSAETGIEPISPALLIGAATYTTLAQLPHAGQQTFDFIAAALALVPGHRLVLGHDVARVPAAIAALAKAPGAKDDARQEAAAPLVSVIIPVFNGAAFLKDAVASLLAQHHPELEIIVVDDGSTDDIDAAIDALPVQVRVLRQANAGPAAARNLGLRAASADLIGFLDVDDLWPEGKLGAALDWLRGNPDCDVVTGQAQLLERLENGSYHFVGNPADNFPDYIGAALYRRRAFEHAGTFDPLLRFGEDLDWFANARRTGLRIDRLDMVTLHVRRHARNSTRGKTAIDLTPVRLLRKALAARRGTSAN